MITTLRGLPAHSRALLLATLMILTVFTAARVASAVVTENVRRDVPIVLDGEVWSVEEVGNTIVVGGNFTQVQVSRGGAVVNQAAIFAYDRDSGQFLEDFRPTLIREGDLAEVRDLEAHPDGSGVYIAGRFTAIDDGSDGKIRVRNRVALLDLDGGRVDRDFALSGVDSAVLSIDVDAFSRLYIGGNFETVFDLAPGRPPIEQQVRGLARVDGATGAFDTGFRYNSQEDIGRFGQGGVVKVVFTEDGRQLYVAHRGAELLDVTRGVVHDSPGVAWITVQANDHFGREYKLLHPDPNDPIQEFYHADACTGVGIQIRDMDVTNDYIVTVHQGGDRGVQCDTAVRFPRRLGNQRPDWVSRAFDSIFSVEVDEDDIYIGGHFRYLVNDTAPSPYPGETVANGAASANGSQMYVADPNVDVDFKEDLVDPGYVFPVGQMGVLDAATGFGNPDFLPQSDAQLGILEITAIERGLLIGQDNGRINFVEVGRSAFFDNEPTAGRTSCRVDLDARGVPVVSWNDIGDVSDWTIRANDRFVATQPGNAESYEHAAAEPGNIAYALRYKRDGETVTESCGSIQRPQPSLTCTANLNANGQAVINWNDQGWSRATVRTNGSFLADAAEDTFRFSETANLGTTTYSVRAFLGSERFETTCGDVTVGVSAPVCTASLAGDSVTLNWNDEGWSRASILRNDTFIAGVDGGTSTFTETAPTGRTTYSIRTFLNGERFDATCGPAITVAAPAAPTLNCTTRVNNAGNLVVTWTDLGAREYVVRTNNSFTETLAAGTTRYVTPANGDEIAIRYRLNGETITSACA